MHMHLSSEIKTTVGKSRENREKPGEKGERERPNDKTLRQRMSERNEPSRFTSGLAPVCSINSII